MCLTLPRLLNEPYRSCAASKHRAQTSTHVYRVSVLAFGDPFCVSKKANRILLLGWLTAVEKKIELLIRADNVAHMTFLY